MPRAGLSPAAVVDHALALIDEQGAEALTLAAVAARARVAAPSLYKHVPGGLAELRRRIAVRVTEEVADRLTEAVHGLRHEEAVAALVRAYVGYARQYPRRYAALPQQPGPDPELVQAATRVVQVILGVLDGYGLTGSEAVHAARTVRAVAHGFAALSTGDAFRLREDLAVTEERLIGVLATGLAAWPGR